MTQDVTRGETGGAAEVERTMLCDEEGQWMYVLDAEQVGDRVVCDGMVGDPGVSMSEWRRATVVLDVDDMPEVVEYRAIAWTDNDETVGSNA